jgi:lipid-A-disaccharide synthase
MLDAISVDKESKNYIALLPGSRKQEIEKILPVMNQVVKRFPNQHFVLGMAPSRKKSEYEALIDSPNIYLSEEGTSTVLNGADAALVTSGTATLETALYEVPQVVCYKGSYVSYLIAKSVVKINYISLVNLIMDDELVKELIQGDLNVKNLHKHLLKIMPNTAGSITQKQCYKELKQKLGGVGASKRAAQRILELF